jgi:hypothetical protein
MKYAFVLAMVLSASSSFAEYLGQKVMTDISAYSSLQNCGSGLSFSITAKPVSMH